MISRDAIRETQHELDLARQRALGLAGRYTVFMAVIGFGITFGGAAAGAAVASGAIRLLWTAVFTTLLLTGPSALLAWSGSRQQRQTDQLMQTLGGQLTDAIDAAEVEAFRREAQVQRQEFETRLANALEMADGEPEVIDVIERAFVATMPRSPVELLLADNSHAHLSRMVSSSPTGEPPRCDVDSPDHCPAARRAQVQYFSDSEKLDACPKLRGRTQGHCSAVCVPVSIMGRTVGVIHAVGEVDVPFDGDRVSDLGTLANLAGARIGLLRVMAETQLQAATDNLTGLMNRRSLENATRQLRSDGTSFTVAMADLDHFKELNDTYGHETGDRALRVFARSLQSSVRSQDLVGRHGGEEFVVVFPHCTAEQARIALEAARAKLESAVVASGLPAFTASFGVVEAGSSEAFVTVISRADAALFHAKRNGRDRVIVHDEAGLAVDPVAEDDDVEPDSRLRAVAAGRGGRAAAPSAGR